MTLLKKKKNTTPFEDKHSHWTISIYAGGPPCGNNSHNTLRKAFFHFWAMTRYTYDFSCIRCGHEPILIADSNWKVAFDLPGKIFIEITVH